MSAIPPICSGKFGVSTSTSTLYVPKGSKAIYSQTAPWSEFTNIVEFGSGELAEDVDNILTDLETRITALVQRISAIEKQFPNNESLRKLLTGYKVKAGEIQNTIYDIRDGIVSATKETVDKLYSDLATLDADIEQIEAGLQLAQSEQIKMKTKFNELVALLQEAAANCTPTAEAQAQVTALAARLETVGNRIYNLESAFNGTWDDLRAEVEYLWVELFAIEDAINLFMAENNGMAKYYDLVQKLIYVCQHYKVSDASAVNAILVDIQNKYNHTSNAEAFGAELSDAISRLNAYLPEVWLLDMTLGQTVEKIYEPYAGKKDEAKYIIALGEQAGMVNFRSFLNVHPNFKNIDLSSTTLIGGFTLRGCLYVENIILPQNDLPLTTGLLDNCPLLTVITSPCLVSVTSATFAGVDKEKVMLYVPRGMKMQYQLAEGWKEFMQIWETGQNVVINNPGDKFEWGDGYYVLEGDNYIKFTGFKPQPGTTRYYIPSTIVINNVFYVVRIIGTGAFVDSNVSEVILPSTPGLVIEPGAFVRCYQLTYITIVKNVTIIMPGAFQDCRNLKRVNVESEDLIGGDYNFDQMFGEQVEYVYIDIYIKRLTGRVFRNTHIKYVYLFDEIEEIDAEVFSGCRWLIHITLPKKLWYIGKWAFLDCENLEEITIPENVREWGEDPFKGCVRLVKVIINNIYIIQTINLGDNGSLGNLFGYQVRHIEIGPGVQVIRKYLFRYLVNLEYVYLPDGVETIEEYAFEGCTKLTYVRIPKTVYVIRIHAFDGCTGFTDVLYNEDKTILVYCNPRLSYKEFVIPESVRIICDGAFIGCDWIVTIEVRNAVPPTATALSFTGLNPKTIILYVPIGMVSTYRLADGWKEFLDIREKIADGIEDVEADSEFTYYTLDGKRVQNPTKGVFIVKEKAVNGSVKTRKVSL